MTMIVLTYPLWRAWDTWPAVDRHEKAKKSLKALNEQVNAQEARIEKLERENQALSRRLREVGSHRR